MKFTKKTSKEAENLHTGPGPDGISKILNITGNFILGNLPEMFRPIISTMKSIPEWNTGNHKRCQINTDGNLVIIGAVSGQIYASTVSFLAKEI